jgi:hypothetical protein
MRTGLSFLQTAKFFLLACVLSICAAGQTPTPIRAVTTLPATCKGGSATASTDVVFLITGTSGEFYRCWASNTWVVMGTMPSDGVHAGSVQLGGNTTPPVLNSNIFAWIGPNSSSFTSWGIEMPSAEPSGTVLLAVGAASSHVSQGSLLALQGTGASVQTAGTVAASQRAVCTDGNAATTTSCPKNVMVLFVTADQVISTTSLNSIPGLSATITSAVPSVVSMDCDIMYSQQTSAVADNFGISDTSAPTNINAQASEGTNLNGGGRVESNIIGLTTTVATSFANFTPAATNVVYNTQIHILAEQPASTAALSILVSTGNASDSITIKRGSKCVVNFQ